VGGSTLTTLLEWRNCAIGSAADRLDNVQAWPSVGAGRKRSGSAQQCVEELFAEAARAKLKQARARTAIDAPARPW